MGTEPGEEVGEECLVDAADEVGVLSRQWVEGAVAEAYERGRDAVGLKAVLFEHLSGTGQGTFNADAATLSPRGLPQRLATLAGHPGVGVVIAADHTCMTLRGVQAPGSRTVTSTLLGTLRDDPRSRAEFFSLTDS